MLMNNDIDLNFGYWLMAVYLWVLLAAGTATVFVLLDKIISEHEVIVQYCVDDDWQYRWCEW